MEIHIASCVDLMSVECWENDNTTLSEMVNILNWNFFFFLQDFVKKKKKKKKVAHESAYKVILV